MGDNSNLGVTIPCHMITIKDYKGIVHRNIDHPASALPRISSFIMNTWLKWLVISTSLALPLAFAAPTRSLNKTACISPNLDLSENQKDADGSPTSLPLYNCYRHEFRTFEGAKLTIDYVHKYSYFQDNEFDWEELTANVSAKVIPEYSRLLGPSAGLDIHINVFDEYLRANIPATRLHLQDSLIGFSANTCYVDMTGHGWIDRERFQYTLAHNLYHCVQHRVGLTPSDTQFPSAEWWYESAAVYFGSSYYSEGDVWKPMTSYSERTPLYRQGDSASLFLLHLSNIGWSDMQIHEWISSQTLTESMEQELARISFDAQLGETFPTFATRLTDKQIKFKNGTVVPEPYAFFGPSFTGHLDQYPWGTRSEISFAPEPFAINQWYQAILTTDRTININFTAENPEIIDGMVLQWKKAGDKTWRKMVSNDTMQVPRNAYKLPRRTVECPERDTMYYFVATKTFDDSKEDDWYHVGTKASAQYQFLNGEQPIDPACEPPKPAVPAPGPVHASMTLKCNKYVMGESLDRDRCGGVLEAGVTWQDFSAWNPVLGGKCQPLDEYAYCIGIST